MAESVLKLLSCTHVGLVHAGVSCLFQRAQSCRTAPSVTSSRPVWLFSWPSLLTSLCLKWYDVISHPPINAESPVSMLKTTSVCSAGVLPVLF